MRCCVEPCWWLQLERVFVFVVVVGHELGGVEGAWVGGQLLQFVVVQEHDVFRVVQCACCDELVVDCYCCHAQVRVGFLVDVEVVVWCQRVHVQ